jgi:hypothetical protein
MFVAYVILKRPCDELFICCMTLAYLYNECSTIVKKSNNCMISLSIVLVNGFFKSYIVQNELGTMELCIWTKIQ